MTANIKSTATITILCCGLAALSNLAAAHEALSPVKSQGIGLVIPDVSPCNLTALSEEARQIVLESYSRSAELLSYNTRIAIEEDYLVVYFDPTEGTGNSNSPEIVFDRRTCQLVRHYHS